MDAGSKEALTMRVQEALRHEGFDLFGIIPASSHPEDSQHIQSWVKDGKNGTMHFMERNIEKRSDISSLVNGAKSIIVAGLRYYSDDHTVEKDNYFVARYARVKDYHTVIKAKLNRVLRLIEKEQPGSAGRVFCDSAPLNEKAWAVRAGLGWQGKHSIVINEKTGSFFFLGEIITTVEFVYHSHPAKDLCGTCRKCIVACPTGAICDDHTIDARRCIAYLTIEHKGELPKELQGKTEHIIFGCDRCQEVCPWNNKAVRYSDTELDPDFTITDISKIEWETMTPGTFNRLFRTSPVKRTGLEKIRRNIGFVSSESPEKR